MSQTSIPRTSRWPFFVGDLLLIVTAVAVLRLASIPIDPWTGLICVLAVLAGACLSLIPFVQEYRAATRLAEWHNFSQTVEQIQELKTLGRDVEEVTRQWQTIQDKAGEALQRAQEMSDRMGREAKDFQDFMIKANDQEKAHLRLEVEKLRRAEGDWLQVLTGILDHVFALSQAAARSGQPNLMEQIGSFEHSCRDTARRVGLVPFVPEVGEPFDPKVHQPVEPNAEPPSGGTIQEVAAVGYNYQGKLLRRALVKIDAQDQEPSHPRETEESSAPSPS